MNVTSSAASLVTLNRMGLGNERTLLTGVKGKCWEATFPAGDDDFGDMQYRYCIIDGKTKTAIFEREPNR